MPTRFDDDLVEAEQLENEYATASAVGLLDPDVDTALADAEPIPPQCCKCDAPLPSDVVTICRRCGWYDSLGIFVEVDPEWEATHGAESAALTNGPAGHVQVWLTLIPWWGWLMIVSVLTVVAESIAAVCLTPAGSVQRTTWSLVQLAIGGTAVVICHIVNFLIQSADDADIGLLDAIVKPANLWIRAARELPKRLWMANLAACGLTAAVMSIAVIGGIPYDALWDWGGEAKKPNLLKTVTSAASKVPAGNGGADLAELAGDVPASGDSLEDAVNEFAGSQNVEAGDGDAERSDSQSAERDADDQHRETIDCAIVGYRLDDRGRVAVLVLAAPHRGRLAYAGWVRPELDEAPMIDLAERLRREHTEQPVLQLHLPADWVWPKYACRVTYSQRLPDGRLTDIEWDGLNGTVRKEAN